MKSRRRKEKRQLQAAVRETLNEQFWLWGYDNTGHKDSEAMCRCNVPGCKRDGMADLGFDRCACCLPTASGFMSREPSRSQPPRGLSVAGNMVNAMPSTAHIQELLGQALDQFDAPGTTVASNVRRASRIASLRRDYMNQLWLQWEMTDLAASKAQKWQDPAIARIKSELDALLGASAGKDEGFRAFLQWERNRTMEVDGSPMVYATSIGQIEESLRTVQNAHDQYVVPAGLTGGDLYYAQQNADGGRAKLTPLIGTLQSILDRVRSAVYSFLVASEGDLENGQPQASLFLRAQDYLNTALGQYAPTALKQFVAAQERLYDGGPEDLAHALTSCRRMIKSLADHVYPATDESIAGIDGVERKMSDDQYRNRLLEYVRQTLGKHGNGEVIQQTLDGLGARLKALDALASKGVHADVTAAEAETCVIWTYLLAADIVRLADGSSALLSTSND